MFTGLKRTVSAAKRAVSKVHTFLAPVRGWVTNENLSFPKGAAASTLDNFFPMEDSIRPRGGLSKWATIHATDAVEALLPYRNASGSQLFACLATEIFDISNPVNPTTIPSAAVTGQTTADYSFINFGTAGVQALLVVNGADRMLYFDGATWRRVDNASAELYYDTQTANFPGSGTVTGATSGATATIVEDLDSGTTGTLRVRNITGTFQDNEIITAGGGSATTNIPDGVTLVPAITGFTTSDASYIFQHNSRVWFIEKDSMSAWYLPVDSIGGAATEVSLAGIMPKGGKLLMGISWAASAGDGVNNYLALISSEGDVAGYQGDYPGASNWRFIGVANIGRPLTKTAVMKAGGDALVTTMEGLIPLSAVFAKDPAALSTIAISKPIEPTWRYVTSFYPGGWTVERWTKEAMAIVAYPKLARSYHSNFVVNLKTGAWARYTGWDIQCAAELADELYIGTSSGYICKCETTALDIDEPYYCTYIGQFEKLNSVMQTKSARMARGTWKYGTNFNYRLAVSFNYTDTTDVYPAPAANRDNNVWDTGKWDVAKWGGGERYRQAQTDWQSVYGSGFVVAPVVQITMGGARTPEVEFVSFDFLYETGGTVL
jgi:hypothetical protein